MKDVALVSVEAPVGKMLCLSQDANGRSTSLAAYGGCHHATLAKRCPRSLDWCLNKILLPGYLMRCGCEGSAAKSPSYMA